MEWQACKNLSLHFHIPACLPPLASEPEYIV